MSKVNTSVYTVAVPDITEADFPVDPEHEDAGVLVHHEYRELDHRPFIKGTLKVVVLNAMRGTHLDSIIERIRETAALRNPDLLIASELDIGMVRSGNRHIPRALAEALEMNYAFGVEFVELSLGDEQEQRLPGENALGLHGNAIFSRFRLEDIRIVRLPSLYDWFRDTQKRIGSRMAVAARLAGTPLTVVSVHLEGRTTPEGRRLQTAMILDAVEGSALIGGDFNAGYVDEASWRTGVPRKRGLVHPIPDEPLFGLMQERGFRHKVANEMGVPTVAQGKQIDWIFIRGVDVASDSPRVVPATAVGDAETRISDHDFVTVKLRLPAVA